VRLVKLVVILFGVYVLVVVGFETWLGYSQPQAGNTIVIVTSDAQGESKPRVVSRLEADGALYVAANHWPRGWYRQVLANPNVTVDIDGTQRAYKAVPVTGEEFDRVNDAHPLGPMIRFLTGYPPRRLVRLDPA